MRFGSIGAPIDPVCLQEPSGVVALVFHNHIVKYAARVDDVFNITEVLHGQRQIQNPKSLLENAEDPLYYFAHGLTPARGYIIPYNGVICLEYSTVYSNT